MRMFFALFFVLLSFATSGKAQAQSSLPDPRVTPGALNPEVTQANIRETICVRGWTKTIRPPMELTQNLKRSQLAQMPYGQRDMRAYEEDHLVPLEVGGAPANPANLWAQPRESADGWNADRKDELENALNHLVCSGQLPLATAQNAFMTNWIQAYHTYQAYIVPRR